MFCISKLLLIILLSETYAYITQNIETTLLPVWNPTNAKKIAFTLKVFGKEIQLNLRKNDQIVSSTFKIQKHDAKGKTEEQSQLNASDSCYYHHKDHISSAVINFCQKYGLEGIIFLEDVTLKITPLQNDLTLSFLICNSCVKKDTNISLGKRHLIKRSLQLFANSDFYHLDNFKQRQRYVRNTQEKLYIELAVFFDESAYQTFMPFLNEDVNEMFNLVITYVNGIQAVFQHPSLNVSIKISLSYLEIFQSQPVNLPHFGGDGNKLLKSFCKYAETYNYLGDDDPNHWDVGLYITGLDLYTLKNGEKDFTPLGFSVRNGSCNSALSCAVVEFGSYYGEKELFITTGFGSIYVAAREIGHNLGMAYDSENNICSKDYIMSPAYDNRGRTSWSYCSRYVAKNLWQRKRCLRDRPDSIISNRYNITGLRSNSLRKWTAKKQCELFLRDRNANVVTLHDACISLQCETLLKSEYYFTGPALPGTYCAPERECGHGECKRVSDGIEWNKSSSNEKSYWTTWIKDTCKSSCLEKSKGVIAQRRYCRNWNNTMKNCKGPSYDVVLCDDSLLCNSKRKTIDELITEQCALYNKIVYKPKFSATPIGSQGLYNDKDPWLACSVHCQLKNSIKFQTPSVKMFKKNIYPYLPDGTWCHVENGQNYYCRQHYCVPENYQFEQNW